MTYCIGVLLDRGMIFASDSRTHAGIDNFTALSLEWREGSRRVFRQLPELRW